MSCETVVLLTCPATAATMPQGHALAINKNHSTLQESSKVDIYMYIMRNHILIHKIKVVPLKPCLNVGNRRHNSCVCIRLDNAVAENYVNVCR